ncbi:hypothetical protein FOZ61_005309 [Perkinsus olseni]|uniref:Uncharacterized protein n=1 Tax=Perkinsus olseni TaxID=32597 RepID=A0A7J6M7J5_PEROL|nr:hypothetical protein FOZ61_005309 [Perkinsus olseni]KAF4667543.1 hypothetical protein FOL46_002438 [Perkinsus olseni]
MLKIVELAAGGIFISAYAEINLPPGVYVGLQNWFTATCWPEMNAVSLGYAVVPEIGVVVASYRNGSDSVLASGTITPYNDGALANLMGPTGSCFYIEKEVLSPPQLKSKDEHSYAMAEKPSNLFCMYDGKLLMFYQFDRLPDSINIGCAVFLTISQPAEEVTRPSVRAIEKDEKKLVTEYPLNFYKVAYAWSGMVSMAGHWDATERIFIGRIALAFASTDDLAFINLPPLPVRPVKFGSRRCFLFWQPSTAKLRERLSLTLTPDLATAEAIIKIYPIRLDNILICVVGVDRWTIELGEDTGDGVGGKVTLTLQ